LAEALHEIKQVLQRLVPNTNCLMLRVILFGILLIFFSCKKSNPLCADVAGYDGGYIDSNWVYHNKGFQTKWILPKGYLIFRSYGPFVLIGGQHDSLSDYLKHDQRQRVFPPGTKFHQCYVGDYIEIGRKTADGRGKDGYDIDFNVTIWWELAATQNESTDLEEVVNKWVNRTSYVSHKTDIELTDDPLEIANQSLHAVRITYYHNYIKGNETYYSFRSIKNFDCVNMFISIQCKTRGDLLTARRMLKDLWMPE
jgi:hypothetical protein